jgi:predicted glycoside hydrolase/deacetylase ChbG (UPF0249 family)
MLGYDAGARLLLITADDGGMCHAVNQGVTEAFDAGLVAGVSVMTAGPWFMELVELAHERPQMDCGVHLSVTSEWRGLRWGPVACRDRVRSLLDRDGYFHASEHDFFRHADPTEVAIEFRAQIQRAVDAGLQPSRLDSHMAAYHWDERFFEIALELAREFRLVLQVGYGPHRDRLRREGWPAVDRLLWESPLTTIEEREAHYRENIRRLTPGLTEMLVFPAKDGDELRAMTAETAALRDFDRRFLTDQQTKTLIEQERVTLLDGDAWRRLRPAV